MQNSTNYVIIDGIKIDSNSYYALLKYILKTIKTGANKDEIKQNLINSGWKEEVIDFIYDVDNIIDKNNLVSSNQIKEVVKTNNSSSSSQVVPKESIEKVESDLKNAIKEFDKFAGKLEMNDSKLNNYDEKLSVLKDTLSEMRGMVLSSEKRIGEFETKIDKVNSVIAGYDPVVLEKKFAAVEKDLSVHESEVSKYTTEVKGNRKITDEYVGLMKKIKSEESLLSILDNIKSKVEKMTQIEKNIEKMSGKVESIFLEFQDKLEILMKVNNKTESYDEILKDLIKDVDSISTKEKTLMSKEEFAKKITSFSDELESVKSVVFDITKKNGFSKYKKISKLFSNSKPEGGVEELEKPTIVALSTNNADVENNQETLQELPKQKIIDSKNSEELNVVDDIKNIVQSQK